MKLNYLTLAAALLFFASCYRPACDDPNIRVQFVHFDSPALANIVVKKYPRGQGFTRAMDSVTVDLAKNPGSYPITAYDDWSFEIPGEGKTFRIDQININHDRGEQRSLFGAGELKNCTNGISFRVNETVYTQQTQSYYTRYSAGVIELYK